MFEQLGLIGCGLMGGSFALALKRAGLVQRVVGFSASSASTDRALALGVIDTAATTAALAVANADLVLLGVPVGATGSTLRAIRDQLRPDALIMDVGSTKGDVVAMAQDLLGERLGQFVPAHPIAGKEKSGVEHADADLYQDRQVILTPIAQTENAQIQRAHAVWTALGAQVKHMTPDAHDAAYAAVSHLPHVLAFALMNSLQDQPQTNEFLSLAGPGFRDFSRIAASDPSVWRDILVTNREALLVQSRHFQQALQAFEQAIQTGDAGALHLLIQQASDARSHWRMSTTKPQG
jgi:prephenate dehydrogenase